jgi:hypothetical protein
VGVSEGAKTFVLPAEAACRDSIRELQWAKSA